MDRHAIAPAIRECEALGFIQVTEHGRAGNAEFRRPNLFRLTYKHTSRADPTHEWRNIKNTQEAELLALKARASSKKRKTGGDISPVSVGETHIEGRYSPVGESPTTALVENPPLLSILGDGGI